MKKFYFMFLLCMCILSFNVYAHEHNESCYSYDTTTHTHEGNISTGGGCYTKPIYHTHDNSCYGNCPAAYGAMTVLDTISMEKCDNPNCETNTDTSGFYTYNTKHIYNARCNGCQSMGQYSYCSVCATENYSVSHSTTLNCLKNESTIEGYELNCNYDTNATNKKLICGETVVSIKPENDVQYVSFNDNVVVTFQNGTTTILKATSNNYDNKKVYNGETIVLTYDNLETYVIFYSKNVEYNTNNGVENTTKPNNGTMSVTVVTPITNQPQMNIVTTTPMVDVQANENVETDSIENDLGIKDTIVMEIEEDVEREDAQEKLETKSISPFFVLLLIVVVIAIIVIVIRCLLIKHDNANEKNCNF